MHGKVEVVIGFVDQFMESNVKLVEELVVIAESS